MASISIEEQQVKDLLKQAIVELLEERQNLFQELIADAIEDVGLINAIREGEVSEEIDKGEVMQILEGAA